MSLSGKAFNLNWPERSGVANKHLSSTIMPGFHHPGPPLLRTGAAAWRLQGRSTASLFSCSGSLPGAMSLLAHSWGWEATSQHS